MAYDRNQDFTSRYRRQILIIAVIALAVACAFGYIQARNAAMERQHVEEVARTLTP